ncbi:MAG: tetratricopeptide repeat protein [Bacteroidia bacterium]
MKRIVFIGLLLFAGALFAQDSKVTTGVMKIESGKFSEGVDAIKTGLAGGVKEKTVPKAYFYLAKGYAGMMGDTAVMNNTPDVVFEAKEAVKKTKETDTGGKYTKSLVLVEDNIHRVMFNQGATYYNNQEYAKALPYLKGAQEMVPDNILYNLLLGYAQVTLNDTASAIKSLDNTLSIWNSTEAQNRDTSLSNNILSTNLMLATLYNMYEKDPRKALNVLEKARKDYPTNADLRNTELSIYQQNPELFEEARVKFEKALKDDPKNQNVKLAYAALLTQNGEEEKGLKLYNEVLEVDADNYQANVNVGAFFINQAVEAQKEYNDTPFSEEAKLAELEKKFLELLGKAYPYMEKAHEADPENPEWINQLLTIATSVPEYLGDAKKWKDKQSALRGGN